MNTAGWVAGTIIGADETLFARSGKTSISLATKQR